jgi:transcription antitermination factor NusG
MTSRWFVFYTIARGEVSAGTNLAALGFQTLVPVERFKRRYSWRRDEIRERAVFPHYGFVQLDPAVSWTRALDNTGVLGLLICKATQEPIPVPEREIATLQLADRLGLFDRTKPPSAGVMVEAVKGPLAGQIGKVLRAWTKERIDVLFRVFGGVETLVSMQLAGLREVA